MRETRLREGDSLFTTTDFNWSPLLTMCSVMDTLLNFSMCLAAIWPSDPTGTMLCKLYNSYRWMNYEIKEDVKIRIICDHFRRVSEANASRASEGNAPCKYYEMERILKLVLAEESLDTSPPTAQASGTATTSYINAVQAGAAPSRGGRSRGGNQRGAGGAGQRKPQAVTPNGRKICFAFNKPQGCQNPPLGHSPGCKDPRTQAEYAHVCIFYFPSSSSYCMKGHPKTQH